MLLCINPGITTGQTSDSAYEMSSCRTNDATPAGVIISRLHKKNEWMLSYRYMNTGMNGVVSGTRQASKNDVFINYLVAPEQMRMDMHMIMLMYGITNRVSIMGMFNYNVTAMNMSMFTATTHNHSGGSDTDIMHSKTSGFGDTKLHVLYGLIKKRNYQLVTSAGLSIPTGNIRLKGKNHDMMYANQRYAYAMQLGSGTFDILPSINYIYQREDISFSTQLSSIVRTKQNTIGYRWGNEITLNSVFAYQWLQFITSSIRVEGTMSDKINGYDPSLYYYNELASNPYNYGGKKINCYIGSMLKIKKGYFKNNRLGIECGIPVYQDMNGIQMKHTHTLYALWAIAFNS